MNNFINALYKLYPQTVRTVGDDAFDVDGNPVAYDKALIQAELDRTAYIDLRVAEYPPIGDQLDALWKGGDAAAEMLVIVQAVKNKYPKSS